jgi:hypothetical protein
VPGNVKRGLSDFYAVQSYLANTGKLDRNVALGAAILSAIVGIVQHPQGTSGSKVLDLIRGNAWRRTTSSTPAGSKSNYYQKVEPGSWLHTPSGQEYKQSPLANQGVGQAYVSIKQALVRTLGSRWCMPEFLISSDASNANYGSTLVAESPWVKYAKRQQGRERWSNERMLWQMLAIRASAGAFRRYGVESLADLMRAVAIVVTGPIVEARDRPQETNRRKILRDSGIISPKTWATEEGYDYEQEQRDGARVSQVTLPAAESRLREAAGLWEGYP